MLAEQDYKVHSKFFRRIAKSRYRQGYYNLQVSIKDSLNSGCLAPGDDIQFNEVVIMLFQYMVVALASEEQAVKDSMFERIMYDIGTEP